ncbi:hypothetical protein Ark11_1493 [Candidatus Ichthyocystis hellenicum]|uniref:Uncharacterized protein n=1 Tax=Candidatus Ichthyocystis hellenicum TaxID=1561003 RepID=A0A0S4M3D8_9BURK|nr:hypothetical protein [Candidatus Ichthyocystis hellenicum]CUT18291.1 hypothetical protein Ark11_1493 [Candidatus Ichthyocystis hellenicum]
MNINPKVTTNISNEKNKEVEEQERGNVSQTLSESDITPENRGQSSLRDRTQSASLLTRSVRSRMGSMTASARTYVSRRSNVSNSRTESSGRRTASNPLESMATQTDDVNSVAKKESVSTRALHTLRSIGSSMKKMVGIKGSNENNSSSTRHSSKSHNLSLTNASRQQTRSTILGRFSTRPVPTIGTAISRILHQRKCKGKLSPKSNSKSASRISFDIDEDPVYESVSMNDHESSSEDRGCNSQQQYDDHEENTSNPSITITTEAVVHLEPKTQASSQKSEDISLPEEKLVKLEKSFDEILGNFDEILRNIGKDEFVIVSTDLPSTSSLKEEIKDSGKSAAKKQKAKTMDQESEISEISSSSTIKSDGDTSTIDSGIKLRITSANKKSVLSQLEEISKEKFELSTKQRKEFNRRKDKELYKDLFGKNSGDEMKERPTDESSTKLSVHSSSSIENISACEQPEPIEEGASSKSSTKKSKSTIRGKISQFVTKAKKLSKKFKVIKSNSEIKTKSKNEYGAESSSKMEEDFTSETKSDYAARMQAYLSDESIFERSLAAVRRERTISNAARRERSTSDAVRRERAPSDTSRRERTISNAARRERSTSDAVLRRGRSDSGNVVAATSRSGFSNDEGHLYEDMNPKNPEDSSEEEHFYEEVRRRSRSDAILRRGKSALDVLRRGKSTSGALRRGKSVFDVLRRGKSTSDTLRRERSDSDNVVATTSRSGFSNDEGHPYEDMREKTSEAASSEDNTYEDMREKTSEAASSEDNTYENMREKTSEAASSDGTIYEDMREKSSEAASSEDNTYEDMREKNPETSSNEGSIYQKMGKTPSEDSGDEGGAYANISKK